MLKKNARLELMFASGFRPDHAVWIDTYNRQSGEGYHLHVADGNQFQKPILRCSRTMNRHIHPIILGEYSPSQNGIIVSPLGIAQCIAGGGRGHDTTKPKILIEL